MANPPSYNVLIMIYYTEECILVYQNRRKTLGSMPFSSTLKHSNVFDSSENRAPALSE